MENKQSNVLFYLALAIGGAFLIHKFMMKGIKSNPVSPLLPKNSVPIPTLLNQSNIKSLGLDLVKISAESQDSTKTPTGLNEYDFQKTYQTLYGQSIAGMYKKCPTTI
jgi:hypothetical protein